jgi:SNF2 family DNA or RNA helicase
MLANIVNGRPPKNHTGPKTTLLVASPALLSQWGKEIEQHTDCKLNVIRYGSGTRLDSNRADVILANHDIVLTTYSEIMKSYPKNEPPIEYQTAEQKIAWWKEKFEKDRGVLHRMQFLRIVLDEAQAIKNHSGRTSIACRALMGEHKWALSGTPILNSLTELYPYFKFLEVPHTGSFKIFKHNYCDSDNAENTDRLLVRLSQFMIRRTHADKMFGAPILKLPQANQSTYWCNFNPVERCIYEIVEKRFVDRINTWQKNGELDKSYSNVLVMLLRLRQLTAHVLMLHVVMRDLLEREDIEKIKKIVKEQTADSNSRSGRTIVAVRKQLDGLAIAQKKKTLAEAAAAKNKGRNLDREDDDNEDQENEEDAQNDVDVTPEDNEQNEDQDDIGMLQGTRTRYHTGGDFGKEFNFKPFLASLNTGANWDRVKKKAKCSYCDKQVREPYITSCGHLICREPCLEESDLIAAENEQQHSACKACGDTPQFMHPCEAQDEDSPEFVGQGTRSKSKKKKESERKRLDREDVSEDWLNSIGDDVLPSAKTIAIKAQILSWRTENPNVKVIIYTQFLAM